MKEMYVNLKQEQVGNFKYDYYFSSSQYEDFAGYALSFEDGSQALTNKNESRPVRAVRAF